MLLAALALRANQVVPGEALTDLVWDGSPPDRAMITLRSYVRRLRQNVGPGGRRGCRRWATCAG